MSSTKKRLVVTGRQGQVVRSLLERGRTDERFLVVPLGRPELDLSDPQSIEDTLLRSVPDVIISAAAYTAVDQAETNEEMATLVNGVAPEKIAAVATALGVPVIHMSTDYVFDGSKLEPYLETDKTAPIGAYGRSKLTGEQAIAAATPNHAILRTAWVYSPFGKNFIKTMLQIAESRNIVNVVDDQIGNPTSALDIADAILAIASNLLASSDSNLRGVFHITGTGGASWADFATEIFSISLANGGPVAEVNRIPSREFPTPVKRPANSRLDCAKLEATHRIRLPAWKLSTEETVARLVCDVENARILS